MRFEDFLYSIGELTVDIAKRFESIIKDLLRPEPKDTPPNFRILRKLVKKDLSIHELISLKLQITFLIYLFINLLIVVFSPSLLVPVAILYFIYLRSLLMRTKNFIIEPEPYRAFYYSISLLTFMAFLGYVVLRGLNVRPQYYYGYLAGVFITVLGFRHVFRSKYGRDYTYGVVEEIKDGAVRVFVHDDIAANVKPGYYWVDAPSDVPRGAVVKLLVEERPLRGAVPRKIIEVYSSSQTSTEPKEQRE
ncbi:DUF2101 family protein [Pyrococcus yayanosii]|uniref:DUF2101 domain-containing protein n=1 Tax=Pyrococcus yayanosii (strain CH1 / JCM 16557) TaxID=529709 RepID=F8AES0_PYRYC|nr:DUF2101 family protein [Pyrococcus yayanosii]AEH24752.1 hypothetical protein PYCH_10710 [Pyrococcus yayanosii CH1]